MAKPMVRLERDIVSFVAKNSPPSIPNLTRQVDYVLRQLMSGGFISTALQQQQSKKAK